MPLPEDTILENRYRIDSLLAYGGMGAVYRAYDTNLQVAVAIKENYFTSPQAVEQFKKEALILARLRHPSLPHVLQHFTSEGQQYLVMEFIPGLNLWEQIKAQHGPFSEAQALHWILQICSAVEYLHNQNPPILHRDIKPQNIKLMPDGQVVLVDFGVAKIGAADTRTATGARGVTPGFSPPEQYSASGSSPASDVYALGATLYALLTATRPPDSVSLAIGESDYLPPDSINPKISKEMAKAIRWAMQPRRNERPQTVAAWQDKLKTLASAGEVSPPQPSPAPAPAAQPSPRPAPETPAPEGIICSQCGKTNRPEVRFCEYCGSGLHTSPPTSGTGPVCSECGKSNRSGVLFCEHCGTRIVQEPSPEVKGPLCMACGFQNRTGIRFCEECGQPLE